MTTIVLEPVIDRKQNIFRQMVGQVNLSRGPTITNYVNFVLEIPENSRRICTDNLIIEQLRENSF